MFTGYTHFWHRWTSYRPLRLSLTRSGPTQAAMVYRHVLDDRATGEELFRIVDAAFHSGQIVAKKFTARPSRIEEMC